MNESWEREREAREREAREREARESAVQAAWENVEGNEEEKEKEDKGVTIPARTGNIGEKVTIKKFPSKAIAV